MAYENISNDNLVSRHHQLTISADVAFIAGGLAGLCDAIMAARAGKIVVLVEDRPDLVGNVPATLFEVRCFAAQ